MAVRQDAGTGWFAPFWNLLWRAGAAALVLWLLWKIRSIVVTFLVAGAFAYFVWFGVEFLVRFRWPLFRSERWKRIWACLFCYAVLVVFCWGAYLQMTPPVRQGIATLSENWDSYLETFASHRENTRAFYHKNVPPDVRNFLDAWWVRFQAGFGLPRAEGGERSPWAWVAYTVEAVLIPVIAFYMIIDGGAIKRELFGLVPRSRTRLAAKIARETSIVMRQYTLSQVTLCLFAGIVTYVVFAIGLPLFGYLAAQEYAVIMGLFAAVTRLVPIVGAIVGLVPIVALAGLSTGSLPAACWVAVVFIGLQSFESKFLYPLIVGSHVKMHPVLVVVALLVGYEFFGIFGMFFAAPIAAVTRNVWVYCYQSNQRRKAGQAPGVANAG
jgi:predicted PurR-regulated permease PerM